MQYRLTLQQLKSLEDTKLAKGALTLTADVTRSRLSLLDSIDGKLLQAGYIALWQPMAGRAGTLTLRLAETGERLVLLPLKRQPRKPADLPRTLLGGTIGDALENRALVELSSLKVRSKTADLEVKGRVIADCHAVCTDKDTGWLWADVRRGFEGEARDCLAAFGKPRKAPAYLENLAERGAAAAALNSKGFPTLKPQWPAKTALRLLHQTLLKQMASQVNGACQDIDIEFLHDLRVASRRARSLLQTVQGVLADDAQAYGLEKYRWVGQRTTDLRDLDVYLDDFRSLEQAVSPEMRVALAGFEAMLKKDRRKAFRSVKTFLQSKGFEAFLANWEATLADDARFDGPDAQSPIFHIASRAISKRYRRICKDGHAITPDSPAEALHDLRKEGKKLRYLLEFFASLYEPKLIKPRIASLKKLQDLLGAYQDCAVQANFLETKAEALRADETVSSDTLMAMGALADQRLQDEKRLRTEFDQFFAPFASKAERQLYKRMLTPPKSLKTTD